MDSMFELRLMALEQSLSRAKDPSGWKDRLQLHNVWFEERIWDWVIMDIKREVDRLLREVDGIRHEKDVSGNSAEGWRRYNEVHRASQELFRDCIELIGGLALRDKLLDGEICQLTDALIVACADGMLTYPSPSIPAHLELPPRTLGHVVRMSMRFPEWTIWTLSLAAYEFGHIAIREIPELKEYCRRQAEVAAMPGTDDPEGMTADRNQLQHVTRCVEVLMADAFATYTLGPAYACPALLLQFNPLQDEGSAGYGPSDVQRGEFVLGILEEMGKIAASQNDFDIVLRELRNQWHMARGHARNVESVILDPVKVLEFFTNEVDGYRPHARYRTDRKDEELYGGWTIAKEWAGHWQEQIKNRDAPLEIPLTVSPTSKLRDALNAAWLCRLQAKPEMLYAIEIVAKDLCVMITSGEIAKKGQTGQRLNPGMNVRR